MKSLYVLGINLKATEKEQNHSITIFSTLEEKLHYTDFKFCGYNFQSATINIDKSLIKYGLFCSKGYATKNGALLLLDKLKNDLNNVFSFKESKYGELLKDYELYEDTICSMHVGRIYVFKNSYDEYMVGILMTGNINVEKSKILDLINEESEVTKKRVFKNVQLSGFLFSSVEFSMKDNETNIGSLTRSFNNFTDAKEFRDDIAGYLEQNYYLNSVMDGKIKSYQGYINNNYNDYVFTLYIEVHSRNDYRVVLYNNPWYEYD